MNDNQQTDRIGDLDGSLRVVRVTSQADRDHVRGIVEACASGRPAYQPTKRYRWRGHGSYTRVPKDAKRLMFCPACGEHVAACGCKFMGAAKMDVLSRADMERLGATFPTRQMTEKQLDRAATYEKHRGRDRGFAMDFGAATEATARSGMSVGGERNVWA